MPAPVAAEIAETFDLTYPVSYQGTDHIQLSARRPKVKDLRVLAKGADLDPVGSYNNFLASICTVPVKVIDELDLADFTVIQKWAKDFLPKSDD